MQGDSIEGEISGQKSSRLSFTSDAEEESSPVSCASQKQCVNLGTERVAPNLRER
jgi:hypothetical protein